MSSQKYRLELEGAVVGHLYADGSNAAFEYEDVWRENGFELGPDVPLTAGRHYPQGEQFGFVEDASPDRWGKTIILREAKYASKNDGRAQRTLSSTDYFVGVSDVGRMGGLRVSDGKGYVSHRSEVPPLVRLSKLLNASDRYQRGEIDDDVLAILLAPGSSLGGARPKASVKDAGGDILIAKFPRTEDAYSVERWEHIAMLLAQKCGISVPESSLKTVAGKVVFLSKRFDRVAGGRVHFASAMNLLGLKDGQSASYVEIAELLQQHGSQPRKDCEELFRRMLFNIRINNVDDHLRNHGFLRDAKGWRLSPAYDLNPISKFEKAPILSTAIIDDEHMGDVELGVDCCEFFGLKTARARKILHEIDSGLEDWQQVAKQQKAPRREIADVEGAFE